MTRVVLGSASPGRRAVLRRAGIDPVVLASGVDEDAVVAALPADATPARVTTALAEAKAHAVVTDLDPVLAQDCVVIGCDSMLSTDGRLLGKPHTAENAIAGWRALAGRTAELVTGHCLVRLRDGVVLYHLTQPAVTRVHFGKPSDEDLAAYIATGEPLAVAGGFTLDGLGGWFIDGVDGDPSTVVGIGLPVLRRLFDLADLTVAALWAANPV